MIQFEILPVYSNGIIFIFYVQAQLKFEGFQML